MLIVPTAHIGMNKNRLKIYNDRFVFLENGQEFQFEIQNPTKDVIGVDIWINGNLSSYSKLVLKPGESVWLDRYLDNPNKYVFETYEVNDTEENKKAIEDNGKIKFEFYREQKRSLLYGNYINIDYTYHPPYEFNYSPSFPEINFYSDNVIYSSCDSTPTMGEIKTGRIGEGDHSKQDLQNVSYNFELNTFHSIDYQILPLSQKNVVTATEVRKYCTNCSLRIKRSNWKYCPACGEKI